MTKPTPAAELSTFEGKPVLSTGIEIPGAAGGLRESLAVDPFEGHKGQRVLVLLETTVDKLRFDPVKDTDGWKRVHILAVDLGMVVDPQDVEAMLAAQRERIAAHKAEAEAEAKGMETITYPTDEELHTAHEAGEHADLAITGCVDCQNEGRVNPDNVTSLADRLEQQAADRGGEAPPPDEYEGLTGPELKALCKERGLPVGGKVDDLRDRLRASDLGGAPS